MPLSIHRLTEDDLDAAQAICELAYGVPRAIKRDLRRYMTLQPDGWVFALLDGKPAGLGGATNYGPFAYIGLMTVHPSLQRRGVATAIMDHLLAGIEARGCPLVLLTATPAGEALYEQRGFVDQDMMLQFVLNDCALRPRLPERVVPMCTDDLAEVAAFDTPIFGANRSVVLAAYLAEYPSRAFVVRDTGGRISGYLFAQVETIGPWVAGDRDSAEALLAAALQLHFEPAPRVLIAGANSSGSALLQRYGFSPQRTLRHMRRGGDGSPTRREMLYGQASFALG